LILETTSGHGNPAAGAVPPKDGVYDHPIDALRYFFIHHQKATPTITRRY